MVEKDLKDLQENLVPADVLLQAKVLLLQQIPLSESSVSAIAGGFLARTTTICLWTNPLKPRIDTPR